MKHPDFRWWMGIVEDRADPEKMGRYRVRILGYHTEDKTQLPVSDLPWATPIMPVSSSSNTGVCETPALVEGTAVVGFFSDGIDEQLPVIVGSMPGMPQQKIEDPNIGFSDPTGEYPRYLNEPDISKLARDGAAEKHESLVKKREERVGQKDNSIRTAKAPSVPNFIPDKSGKDYSGSEWEEPHPRFGSTDQGTYTKAGDSPSFEEGTTSVYPFNQVKETESGHVFEIDDTPANGRIHEYHNAGTFREIQADGTRVTKVVGKDYQIVLDDKNVFIQGGCNVTIKGDCKLRVDGDYYQEVAKDYFLTIGGDRIVKMNGNDILEVGTDSGTNINGNKTVRVAKDNNETIVGNDTLGVGKDKVVVIDKKLQEQINGKASRLVRESSSEVVVGDNNIMSGSSIQIGADQNIKITAKNTITEKAKDGNIDMITETADIVANSARKVDLDAANDVDIDAPTVTIDGPAGNITSNGVTLHTHIHKTTSLDTGTGINAGVKNDSDAPTSPS